MRNEKNQSGGRPAGGLPLSFMTAATALIVALSSPWTAHAAAGAYDCFEEARNQPAMTDLEAIRLCQDAESAAPADCYAMAREQTFLSSQDALRLCTFAQSTAPAECAAEAENEATLSDQEVLELCGRRGPWGLP